MKEINSGFTIAHMVAASENNVIGVEGNLPWNLPDDFKFFKNKTWGLVVIMGRKTFESLKKPLSGRINIVITRNAQWKQEGVQVAHDIEEAIRLAIDTDCKEIFIIGGGNIYQQSMQLINKIYLTRVHKSFEGDTYYPSIDERDWKLTSSIDHPVDEKNNVAFTFEQWERNDL